MNRIKALAFGEILWDVFEDKSEIGGAPFNFISWMTRLGADGFLCSAVGGDKLGEKTLSIIKERGVSTELCQVNELPTGVCKVTLSAEKSASYDLCYPVAYDNIECDTESINSKHFDLLYFGTLIQRSEHNRKVLNRILGECSFKEIFCDVNLRKGQYDKESVLLCMENATMLKLNDEELAPVADFIGCEASVKEIAKKYPNIRLILFTKGENGSEIYDFENDTVIEIPPVTVDNVVSTVGAGDSYAAAFAYNYCIGKPLAECGMEAAKISAYVVTQYGAI